MCKVIAITNQKGGCAKTNVTVNLGIGLAREELKQEFPGYEDYIDATVCYIQQLIDQSKGKG